MPIIVFQVGGALILGSESGKERLRVVLATVSFERVILVIVALFFVVDLILLRIVMARFKRSRLILSQ